MGEEIGEIGGHPTGFPNEPNIPNEKDGIPKSSPVNSPGEGAVEGSEGTSDPGSAAEPVGTEICQATRYSLYSMGAFYCLLLLSPLIHDFLPLAVLVFFLPIPLAVWALFWVTDDPAYAPGEKSFAHFVLAVSFLNLLIGIGIFMDLASRFSMGGSSFVSAGT